MQLPLHELHTAAVDIFAGFCLGPQIFSCPCKSHTVHSPQYVGRVHTPHTSVQNVSPETKTKFCYLYHSKKQQRNLQIDNDIKKKTQVIAANTNFRSTAFIKFEVWSTGSFFHSLWHHLFLM